MWLGKVGISPPYSPLILYYPSCNAHAHLHHTVSIHCLSVLNQPQIPPYEALKLKQPRGIYFLSSNVVHLFFASVAYGVGFVAVVVVSLVSLIGVLTVPVAGKRIMRYLSACLVAMGISALASDAVLHLIPHVGNSCGMYAF